MSAHIVTLPRPPLGRLAATADKPEDQVIAEFIAERLAERSVAAVYGALLRVLAGICTVNAINRTEALEIAAAMARDLGETVEQWLEQQR
jgi:hypothetical protein